MKKNYLLIVCLFALIMQINVGKAQDVTYGNWITVYSDAAGSISISFKINTKDNVCKGMGYSFYRIQSTFNENVFGDVHFTNIDCDGIPFENIIPIAFDKGPAINQGLGNWFLGYKGPTITNIRVDSKMNNLTDRPWFPDREKKKEEEERAKSEAEALKKKKEQDEINKKEADRIAFEKEQTRKEEEEKERKD